jgi:hypothetical protein
MALRVARGLFRLWIVCSVLFVIVVAVRGYSEIKALYEVWPGEPLVPQLCGEARGVGGVDYSTSEGQPGPWDDYAKRTPLIIAGIDFRSSARFILNLTISPTKNLFQRHMSNSEFRSMSFRVLGLRW